MEIKPGLLQNTLTPDTSCVQCVVFGYRSRVSLSPFLCNIETVLHSDSLSLTKPQNGFKESLRNNLEDNFSLRIILISC